jgi:hypothetical protein
MSFEKNMQGLLSNPTFGFGLGLLTGAAPGQNFATGAQAGLLNAQGMMAQNQQMQNLATRQALMQQQVNAAEKQKERNEQFVNAQQSAFEQAGLLGGPQPYAQAPAETFPGEQPIPGLQTMTPPDPVAEAQMALIRNYPQEFAQAQIESQFRAPPKQSDLAMYLGADEATRAQIEQYKKAGAPSTSVSVGGKAVDKGYATEFVNFTTGKAADMVKNISQLKEARTKLASGSDNLTGSFIGLMPDRLKTFVNPESIATREAVEEVVQRNLREILGAQFTEKEGARLIARAYNENLPEPENVKRLDRLIKQMELAYEAKIDAKDYWDRYGTLQGWKGTMPTIDDFYEAVGDEGSSPQSGLAIGTVDDGYEYIGGDPALESSWRKQ